MAKHFAAQMEQLARSEASFQAYALPHTTCVPEFTDFPRICDFHDLDDDGFDQFDAATSDNASFSASPANVNVDKIVEFSQRHFVGGSQCRRSQRGGALSGSQVRNYRIVAVVVQNQNQTNSATNSAIAVVTQNQNQSS
jgi:hypothetical protein